MALFWHTAYFMTGVLICTFFIARVKKRYERQRELANPKGFYDRHAPCTRLHADNTPALSLPTHHDFVCSVFTTPRTNNGP